MGSRGTEYKLSSHYSHAEREQPMGEAVLLPARRIEEEEEGVKEGSSVVISMETVQDELAGIAQFIGVSPSHPYLTG